MGMTAIYNAPAKALDTLKRFADSIDGIEKLGNIITAIAGLILLGNGSSPVWLQTLSENFSNYESFKNSFNWIRTGDGFFSNPYSFKDFTFSKFLILTRRICFLGVTTLATLEYWNKLNKFTPPASFPIKFCLLLATTILSNIISGIDLYDNSVEAKKLKMKKIIMLDKDDSSVDQSKLTEKMKTLADRINKLKDSVGDTLVKKEKELAVKPLQNAKESDLNKAAEKWLEKVNALNVQQDDYYGLKKQIKMLKLLENPSLENLNDVRALLEMKDNKTFQAFKVEQFHVREENLTVERKKAWRSIAQEIAKMGVFGFLILNAPYLALVPADSTFVVNVTSKCVSLISGLIGFEKFLFESHHNKVKEDLHPKDFAIPLPV